VERAFCHAPGSFRVDEGVCDWLRELAQGVDAALVTESQEDTERDLVGERRPARLLSALLGPELGDG
jgi:hypothetical protein